VVYGRIILASWLVLIAVWFAMARRVKTVAEHETAFSTFSHYAPLGVGLYLLAAPRLPIFPLDVRFAPLALWPVQLGALLTIAGVAFAIWARVLLAVTGVRASRSSAATSSLSRVPIALSATRSTLAFS
jgi:hypothetical protein